MKAEKIASYKPSINSFEVSLFPLLPMSLGPLASFQIKVLNTPLSLLPREDEGWQGWGLWPEYCLEPANQSAHPTPNLRQNLDPGLLGGGFPQPKTGLTPTGAQGEWRLMRF